MLQVNNLCVTGKQDVILLNNINMTLDIGECIGLTGASGAGKTTLIKAVMGTLDSTCRIISGKINLDNILLTEISKKEHRQLCGTTLGFIPQNPMTAFDRRCSIGNQMVETFKIRLGMSRKEAEEISQEALEKVNLLDIKRIMNAYPSQLSGGMIQRITMAILWAMKPKYIFADEPTSALDEKNRDILLELLKEYINTSGILFLSHDFSALKSFCQKIIVMEKGMFVEEDKTKELFEKPQHEWTKKFVFLSEIQGGERWKWKELK